MNTNRTYTLEELVAEVNVWCEACNLAPPSGQSAEQLSLRTLRYYRTMGLLNGPKPGSKNAYREIHRLQLLAIRVLQAQGQPLRRIQTLLYGRSESDLREVLKRGAASLPPQPTFPALQGAEDWRVLPINPSVWLILRDRRKLSPDQVARIQAILDTTPVSGDSTQLQQERTP
jgi:DNA-binding transcriptional MerR regulator